MDCTQLRIQPIQSYISGSSRKKQLIFVFLFVAYSDKTFFNCFALQDRDRLRSECNELEAVVAALQQQLEAQTAQLTPKATEELLRTAGTEPCDEELEIYSRIVTGVKQPNQINSNTLSGSSDAHAVSTAMIFRSCWHFSACNTHQFLQQPGS